MALPRCSRKERPPVALFRPRFRAPSSPEAARPEASAAQGLEDRASAPRFRPGNPETAYPDAAKTGPCRPSAAAASLKTQSRGLKYLPSGRALRSSCPRRSGSRFLLSQKDIASGSRASAPEDAAFRSARSPPSRGEANIGPRPRQKTPDTPVWIFLRSRA